jgi:chromosome segregation ATPase
VQNQRTAEDTARTRAIEQRDHARWMLDESRTALETQVRELAALERERTFASQEAAERVRERDGLALEIETLARSLADAEAELAQFQGELDVVRAQLAEADGTVRTLESRRDEAYGRAQSSRELLLQLSRESGDLESQWARLEQTLQELGTGIGARQAEAEQHRGGIAGLEAEVAGLSSGLTGLLESEGTQRERVVELQKSFLAVKEDVQGLDRRPVTFASSRPSWASGCTCSSSTVCRPAPSWIARSSA